MALSYVRPHFAVFGFNYPNGLLVSCKLRGVQGEPAYGRERSQQAEALLTPFIPETRRLAWADTAEKAFLFLQV